MSALSNDVIKSHAATKLVVLAQPHQSVTSKQSRFRVLHTSLIIPMETRALKNILIVLNRVQNEKENNKNFQV